LRDVLVLTSLDFLVEEHDGVVVLSVRLVEIPRHFGFVFFFYLVEVAAKLSLLSRHFFFLGVYQAGQLDITHLHGYFTDVGLVLPTLKILAARLRLFVGAIGLALVPDSEAELESL